MSHRAIPEPPKKPIPPCFYNKGVMCGSGFPEKCLHCGWNPKVDEARKDTMREKREAEQRKLRDEEPERFYSKAAEDQSYYEY